MKINVKNKCEELCPKCSEIVGMMITLEIGGSTAWVDRNCTSCGYSLLEEEYDIISGSCNIKLREEQPIRYSYHKGVKTYEP